MGVPGDAHGGEGGMGGNNNNFSSSFGSGVAMRPFVLNETARVHSPPIRMIGHTQQDLEVDAQQQRPEMQKQTGRLLPEIVLHLSSDSQSRRALTAAKGRAAQPGLYHATC
jgi:hypothetical protein